MARPRYLPGTTHIFRIKRNLGRCLLDEYVASRLSISARRATELLAGSAVTINGTVYGAGSQVDLPRDSELRVDFPDEWPEYMRPRELPLDIIYEDEAILVLNKAPGVVMHPARGHMDGRTLQNGVLHRYEADLGHPETTIGPAHRLDRDTSGVVVFSRIREAYRQLSEQFSSKTVKKEYLAIVDGQLPLTDLPSGVERLSNTRLRISQPIGTDPENLQRSAILPIAEGGKDATTEIEVITTGKDWSKVLARPETGRGHQIRLHLSYLGCPIVADPDYNPNPGARSMKRQALHAQSLTIQHPISGDEVCFEAPLPDDILELIASLP